jgi:hypothetical protein
METSTSNSASSKSKKIKLGNKRVTGKDLNEYLLENL